ncbi:MAG TPA: hypothetical protein VGH13_17810, partial [Xanthobacteraceae bacterium]
MQVKIDYMRVYSDTSLNQDIRRLRELWRKLQSDRDRDAIYDYLSAVSDLVGWWAIQRRAVERARRALKTNGLFAHEDPEPFAAVIAASVSPKKLDRRQLSKYSRALRYAAARNCHPKRLKRFIKATGGLNVCA